MGEHRPLIEYPKLRWGFRSKSRKLGVQKQGYTSRRELLILGTGRCGTTTVAKVLSKIFDIDLQRERVGDYGTSSLYFTVDSDWHPAWHWEDRVHVGERRSDFDFKHTLQVVRHPAKTIPSMGAVFPGLDYEFFEENNIIPEGVKSQTLRCAMAYYALNKLSEKQSEYRFKIEEFGSAPSWRRITRLLDLPNLPPPEIIPKVNKASGFRRRDPLEWSKLDALDHRLCKNIQKMAIRYGYS